MDQRAIDGLRAQIDELRNRAAWYEELRTATDGGSESMTHEDAVAHVKAMAERNAQFERLESDHIQRLLRIETKVDALIAERDALAAENKTLESEYQAALANWNHQMEHAQKLADELELRHVPAGWRNKREPKLMRVEPPHPTSTELWEQLFTRRTA